jgi:hypothetical protein
MSSFGLVKVTPASVPTPPVGQENYFTDITDDKFKKKLDDGSIVVVESGVSSVSSVFGRIGAVVAVSGDYIAAQVTNTPAGNIIATNVQNAINELDTEKLTVAHQGAGGPGEHPLVTGAVAGFMSPSDKTKIDTVQTGATANQTDSYLLDRTNHTSTQLASTISNFDAQADSRITLQKGNTNGLASLDGTGKVPLTQLPSSVVGGVTYISAWNAAINSPPLASGVGTKGYYYVVNVAGSTSLDGISSWNIGDWVIFDGIVWEKVDNTDSVSSVNGQVGTVVLTKSDIGLSNVDNTSDLNKPISTATQTALNLKADLTNAINQLTGEVTAGPGGGSQAATVSNAAVIGKLLTGLSEQYGVVEATDTILQAISKLVYTPGIQAKDVNASMTIPSGYVLIRGETRLTGTNTIKINSGATLKII